MCIKNSQLIFILLLGASLFSSQKIKCMHPQSLYDIRIFIPWGWQIEGQQEEIQEAIEQAKKSENGKYKITYHNYSAEFDDYTQSVELHYHDLYASMGYDEFLQQIDLKATKAQKSKSKCCSLQ